MQDDISKLGTFSMLYEVGAVVRDLKKVVRYYESLGIGPFEAVENQPAAIEIDGRPATDIRWDIMKTHFGPLGFTLTQPVSGKSIQKGFLETQGEGVYCLRFLVDDVQDEISKMAQRGVKAISSGKYRDGSGKSPENLTFACFDTRKVGGTYFEVVRRSSAHIPNPPPTKVRTTFSQPCQVAMVVKDMGRAIEYYESLGIGPFGTDVGKGCRERVIRGRSAPNLRLDVRKTFVGPYSFELMQPVEDRKGETIQSEILNTRGEAFIHICFLADNVEQGISHLAKKGCNATSTGKYPDATGNYPDGRTFAYLDTPKIGGVTLELTLADAERMREWETLLFPGW